MGFIEGSVKGAGGAGPSPTTAFPRPSTAGALAANQSRRSGPDLDLIPSIRRTVRPATAHVVSAPPGIDCPLNCSASFGQGVNVTIQATADSSSVIEVVERDPWTAGPTTQRLPGNSMACGWPGLVAARDAVRSNDHPGERFGFECPC